MSAKSEAERERQRRQPPREGLRVVRNCAGGASAEALVLNLIRAHAKGG